MNSDMFACTLNVYLEHVRGSGSGKTAGED